MGTKSRLVEQVPTVLVSAQKIMKSRAFAQGVSDMRRGTPARFDEFAQDPLWAYERGRQWAAIAPMSLPLTPLSIKAILIFDTPDIR